MQILGLPIRVSLAPAEFGVSGLFPPSSGLELQAPVHGGMGRNKVRLPLLEDFVVVERT